MANRKPPTRDPVGPGQESVWDYPRPPALERVAQEIRVIASGVEVAQTTAALRVLETSHPPTYYLPPNDIDRALLVPGRGRSFCEWKGAAEYWSLQVGGRVLANVGWSYPTPPPRFGVMKDHIAFYAHAMDACYVDGELATPQPGGFCGGWVTSNLAGPFKGEPGTEFW